MSSLPELPGPLPLAEVSVELPREVGSDVLSWAVDVSSLLELAEVLATAGAGGGEGGVFAVLVCGGGGEEVVVTGKLELDAPAVDCALELVALVERFAPFWSSALSGAVEQPVASEPKAALRYQMQRTEF